MNISSIITAIVVAIGSIALLIPALDALNESLIGIQNAKKEAAKQQCYVNGVRDKIPFSQLAAVQTICENDSNENIDKEFKTAFDMIQQFRDALKLQQEQTTTPTTTTTP